MHFITNSMEKLSDVSVSPVPAAQPSEGGNAVENPPERTREDQVGPEHPVVNERESGEVVPNVMTESPPEVEAEQPKVVVKAIEYPRQADMGRVSPTLSVCSGSSGTNESCQLW